MAKDEKPSHVKTMEKVNAQWEEADLIADTTEVDMGRAFHESLDKIRDDKKRINYKLLDPSKNGDKYHHAVADEYMGKLKKLITAKMGAHKFSDAELSLAIEGMYGETKRHYMDLFREKGANFKISQYKDNLDQHVQQLRNRLYSKAGEDLKSEQFASIMNEILGNGKDGNGKAIKGKSDWLKVKDMEELNQPLFRDDIAALIRAYYTSNGDITRNQLKALPNLSKYMSKDPKQMYVHDRK